MAEAIRPVRDQVGREMMRLGIEAVQEALVGMEDLPAAAAKHRSKKPRGQACSCPRFKRKGFRKGRRTLRTPLGEVSFRLRNVRCERCGRRHAPVLRYLGLAARQRRLAALERVVAEVVSLETYGRSESLVERMTGRRVPDSTMHRWVAETDWDELGLGRYKRVCTGMADGTGFKKRGGQRGELRVVIGLNRRMDPFPLGVYSGREWKHIGREVKNRLRGRKQAGLFVHDGEKGLSEHLSGVAEKEARCRWHMPRGLKYTLWKDGVENEESRRLAAKLHGILAIEIPDEDWRRLRDEDLEPLREELERGRQAYRELADEFGRRGYAQAQQYLERAMKHVFTQVETWLATGVVMPGTISALERIMRELGRRLKKLGYGWTDEGIARVAKVLLKKIYEPEGWEDYWARRENLCGRCSIVLLEASITEVSIMG
jgi:hypothetical protein